MPANQNDLHRMLGEILGKVGAVERQIDEIKEGIEGSNDRADRSRASIYQSLGDIARRTTSLEVEVVSVKRDILDVKTVTDEVKQWKQRGLGALFFAGIAGTAIGGTAMWFLGQIIRTIKL